MSRPVPAVLDETTAAELRRRERAAFEEGAAAYQAMVAEAGRAGRTALLDLVGLEAGDALLDVCTGPGWLALEAAARRPGVRAHGVDLSAAMIELARRNALDAGIGAAFEVRDAAELGHDDASFDRVTCGMGLMHLPDPGGALGEMARVTRPGGTLAVSVWGAPHQTFHGTLADALRDVAGATLPLDYAYLTRLGDPDVLTALLREAGWRPQRTVLHDADVVLPDAGLVWQGMAAGGTTYASLLGELTVEQQDAVRQRFLARCEAFRRRDGLHLPTGLLLVSATR